MENTGEIIYISAIGLTVLNICAYILEFGVRVKKYLLDFDNEYQNALHIV